MDLPATPITRLLLAWLATFATPAAVPGEQGCGEIPSSNLCAARLDYVLVIDNSYSLLPSFDVINDFLTKFVDNFKVNTEDDALSPKLSIVTFSGCGSCSKEESAQVLYPLTSDMDALRRIIGARPKPDIDMPFTCISCGLELANSMRQFTGREDAKPVMLLLSDGIQTIHGPSQEAIDVATEVKATGVELLTLAMGDSNEYTMDTMASSPPEVYAHTAQTVQAHQQVKMPVLSALQLAITASMRARSGSWLHTAPQISHGAAQFALRGHGTAMTTPQSRACFLPAGTPGRGGRHHACAVHRRGVRLLRGKRLP